MTTALTAARTRRLASGTLAGLLSLAVLTACTGGDEGEKDQSTGWDDAASAAKANLDETSGIEVSLATEEDPGTNFLKSATGTITSDPEAFEGLIDGKVMGFAVSEVPVISVDGSLWINHLALGGWSDQFQPQELCAPDPASLLDPETGVSNVLTSSTDMEAGEQERGGEDNKEIFTTYSGTATGDSIRAILPCAEGEEFEATYRVDDDGYLRTARLTGVFFAGADPMTYTIDITAYDVTKSITAPE